MAKKKSKKSNKEDIIGCNTSKKKDNPPKKKKKSIWNKIRKVILVILKIILILAIIVGIFIFLFVSPVFNIVDIRVENFSKISENTYKVLSDIQIGENIFKISKTKIKNNIEKEPYVEKVEVIREYPGTIVLKIEERSPKYLIEKNGIYMYIDKNGYILEENSEKLELPILKGIVTNLNNIKIGDRIEDKDLLKFNDLIKILDGIKNHKIEAKIESIDISDNNNYILNFADEYKEIILGDVSHISTKMIWIKYFLEQKKEEKGIIHLESENVYFTPSN